MRRSGRTIVSRASAVVLTLIGILSIGACNDEATTPTVAPVGAQVIKVSGDAQSDTVAQTLPQPLVVQVNDATGHPVAGVNVGFAAGVESGSVGSPAAVTNASGQAQTTWTLGTVAGGQTASATVGTLPALSFTATATPGAPAIVAKQAGDSQTAVSGQAVAVRPAVIVRDGFNNLTPGAAVTFAASAGNGVVVGAAQTTSASGIATVGSWTLGNTPGTDTLTATVAGSGITDNPAVFTATSQTARVVVAYAGNNQKGLVGYRVNQRPAVRVTDAGSNAVAGAAVTFTIGVGGGSLTNGVATTNANGIAQVGSWTLGATPGTNTMTATVAGPGTSGNPVTFADTGKTADYDIQLTYYGPTPTPAAQTAFNAAVAKWESVIYQHVGAPNSVNLPANGCNSGQPAVVQTVTDVVILATLDSIDGPSGILGFAGPCVTRMNGLALVGVMVFDSADIANLSSGTLNAVILHEMGHVLGFGTAWGTCRQLSSSPPGGIQDTYFGCPKARAAFDSIGGTNYSGGTKVPVENCGTSPYVSPLCGSGTVNSHWREVVFNNELMTGYINSGINPFSVLSIAAQEDLGYTVNYAAADAYTRVFMAPPMEGTPPLSLGDDIRHGPIYVVDAAGTVVRVILNR